MASVGEKGWECICFIHTNIFICSYLIIFLTVHQVEAVIRSQNAASAAVPSMLAKESSCISWGSNTSSHPCPHWICLCRWKAKLTSASRRERYWRENPEILFLAAELQFAFKWQEFPAKSLGVGKKTLSTLLFFICPCTILPCEAFPNRIIFIYVIGIFGKTPFSKETGCFCITPAGETATLLTMFWQRS